MKIYSHKVSFKTDYLSQKTSSLGANYFSFQDSLENRKLNNINQLSQIPNKNLSSDFIISELTRAIMKNLFLLRKQTKMLATNMRVSTSEYEALSFQTKATIITDKKEINVDINLSMQRSFTQNIGLNSLHVKGVFADPLIISLDENMPLLSEKTFYFDIDSDGEKEQISLLGKNAAFLALDKNQNGIIDQANELFGAKSGNGFEDLRLYDEDGNGWIDENDKIFHKLRIWKKNEKEDRLLALGEVGIGAIYLGNVATPFSINETNTNASLGKMRSSGFFLKEDGSGGIISQIDLAIQDKKSNALKEALSLFDTKDIGVFQSKKSRKTIFHILMEHIKQLEISLIKSSKEDNQDMKRILLLLKRKVKEIDI